ncbi:MAG: hypothetical protein ACRCVW_03550 [Brevinema sp.]
MFLEFGKIIINRHDIPNQETGVLIYMIVLPILWILRGCSLFGVVFPVFRSLYNIFFEKTHFPILIFTIIWISINISILYADISFFWKWLWIDFTGIIIFINTISFYINKLITRSK